MCEPAGFAVGEGGVERGRPGKLLGRRVDGTRTVKRGDLVALLEEIGGHVSAHVSEPDEGHLR